VYNKPRKNAVTSADEGALVDLSEYIQSIPCGPAARQAQFGPAEAQ